MEEAAGRERPPWRCTVAVQAALCLALYAAFSLGEPQLIPRGGGAGGVDALGRGSRGGGAFLSVSGGARGPIEQARLLRQVRAFALTHPPPHSGMSSLHAHLPAPGSVRGVVFFMTSFGFLSSPVCDLALPPFPFAS